MTGRLAQATEVTVPRPHCGVTGRHHPATLGLAMPPRGDAATGSPDQVLVEPTAPLPSDAIAGQRGQATVELAALLPLLAVIALAAYSLLAGLAAGEQAGVAAEAGAIALLQDRDPATAAREALSERVRRTASVRVHGRRVTVAVRPRVPLVARLLRARVTTHAGPEPTP